MRSGPVVDTPERFENGLLRQSVTHLEAELERLQRSWWWRVGSALRLVPPSEEQRVRRRV